MYGKLCKVIKFVCTANVTAFMLHVHVDRMYLDINEVRAQKVHVYIFD